MRPAAAIARWMRWLPGLQLLRHYPADWWRHDVAAGLVLTTMLVPVGIAYAVASGVPGIHGLYATIAGLLAYALFGPSRILVMGPDSSLAALILAVLLPLAAGDPARAVALAGAMAIAVGLIGIVAGLAKLGFITELLSKPIRYGYMNGIALAVIVSQLPKLCGIAIAGDGPPAQAVALVQALWDGRLNAAAFGIGAASLVLILLLKRWPRVPGMLIAIVAATAAVALFDLDRKHGVSVLGTLPQGLPSPALPWIGWADLMPVLGGALAVALVAFADTSVLSRTYAQRLRQPVDPNQEMVALGATNLAVGLFQGFPISSSSSRTPVAEAAGLEIADDRRGRRARRGGAAAAGAAVAGAAAGQRAGGGGHRLGAGPDRMARPAAHPPHPGLGVLAVHRLRRGRAAAGCDPGHRAGDRRRGDRVPVGRLAPAFGGAGQGARRRRLARRPAPPRGAAASTGWCCCAGTRRCSLPMPNGSSAWCATRWPHRPRRCAGWWSTAEPVTSVDVTAADMLRELDESLQEQGIELCFAEMKGPVKDKLKRFGLFSHFGQQTFFATIDDAVRAYLEAPPAVAAGERG